MQHVHANMLFMEESFLAREQLNLNAMKAMFFQKNFLE